MTLQQKLLRSVIITGFAALASVAVAQTGGGTSGSASGGATGGATGATGGTGATGSAGTSGSAAAGTSSSGTSTSGGSSAGGSNTTGMGTGQAMSPGSSRMTSDQVRDYLDARNKCGAPSATTQACIDDVHKRYSMVDPKCRTLFGSALTDCIQSMSKGG